MKESREHLIFHYLDGKLTPEERRTFESWQNESEENRKMVEEYQRLWDATKDKTQPIDFQTNDEWRKFASAAFTGKVPIARNRMLYREHGMKIAATFLLICISAFLSYLLFFKTAYHEIRSTDTQIYTTLPDGSEIWLNAGSHLSYSGDFNRNRTATLEGEAFFDVRKDSEHPFTIRTSDAIISVLGTSFNVRAFESDTVLEVVVVTGKVNLKSAKGKQDTLLTPGLTGVLSRTHHQLTIASEEDPNRLSWKNKELIFSKAPLRNVVKALSSYFKKDFRINNQELLDCRFTGSFKDPSLDEILESLNFALNLQIDQQNETFILDGKGCKGN